MFKYNILVFTQPTCAPCRPIKEMLEKLADNVTVVDIWKHTTLALYHKVTRTPLVLVIERATGKVLLSSYETNVRMVEHQLKPYMEKT